MTTNSLHQARSVARPSRDAMLQRQPSVSQFWHQDKELFEKAWREWEEAHTHAAKLDSTLYDPKFYATVTEAWENPEAEDKVRELWTEVLPGVYEAQFFDPEKLANLRAYLDDVAHADIPLRPPYGIVLNRGGAMLDPRSEGYLAAPTFQTFYRDLMNRVMRPVSRLLFPEVTGYDTETFGFSIQWQADKDTSLRPHTDASSVTLNINLNLPGEDFSGSAVGFFDRTTGQKVDYTFKPGSAVIHRGDVPHVSQPIIKGERSNFVLWLYGEHGRIPSFGAPSRHSDPHERWTIPQPTGDTFAPF
ncbi:MAG: 2OG-Fe(II) oxygenase [Pseudomonadota bacterium]